MIGLVGDEIQAHRQPNLFAQRVKSNWEKAEQLYLLADESGSPSAWSALVASLAVAERDNGKALWYAAQRPSVLPPACRPNADPLSDLEGFNQGLARMPSQQFRECVYLAGVLHEVLARVQFPPDALHYGVQGAVRMTFKPPSGTIDWHFEPSADRHVVFSSQAEEQFEDERKIERSLLDYMTGKGKIALSRYERPEGMDPAITLKFTFNFEIR